MEYVHRVSLPILLPPTAHTLKWLRYTVRNMICRKRSAEHAIVDTTTRQLNQSASQSVLTAGHTTTQMGGVPAASKAITLTAMLASMGHPHQ